MKKSSALTINVCAHKSRNMAAIALLYHLRFPNTCLLPPGIPAGATRRTRAKYSLLGAHNCGQRAGLRICLRKRKPNQSKIETVLRQESCESV